MKYFAQVDELSRMFNFMGSLMGYSKLANDHSSKELITDICAIHCKKNGVTHTHACLFG